MTETFLVKTRYSYDSYSDLRRLYDLSGIPTCFVDEIDPTRNAVYIVSPINGEFRPHMEHRLTGIGNRRQARVIFFNLERPIEISWDDLSHKDRPVFACTKSSFDTIPEYVDRVWVADRLFAESMQSPRVRFVPLGSHPGLYTGNPRPTNDSEFLWDFAHLSYVNERRQAVLNQLQGLRCAPNAWPPERDEILRLSKVLLNIHQTDHQIGEPLRFAVAAAAKIPVISETIQDPWPIATGSDVAFGPEQLVAGFCRSYVTMTGWPKSANRLYETLCVDFPFERNIRAAVRELCPNS